MSDATLAALLDAFPMGVALVDHSGAIRLANRAAGRILGREPVELVGRPLFDALRALAGAEEFAETFPARLAGETLDDAFGTSPRARLRSYRDASGPAAVVILEAGASTTRAAELASHVKHDVNNLLMGLLGQTALLGLRPDLAEAVRGKLALIEEHGKKIRDRVADLDEIRRPAGGTDGHQG